MLAYSKSSRMGRTLRLHHKHQAADGRPYRRFTLQAHVSVWVQGVWTVDWVGELGYYGRRLTWRVGADVRCPPPGGGEAFVGQGRVMSSSPLLLLYARVFFVTTCARHLRQPFADRSLAKEVIESLLFLLRSRDWRLYCYCLMPDHLHLAVSPEPQKDDLSRLLQRFKSFTTRLAWRHGYRGALWQRSYYDH